MDTATRHIGNCQLCEGDFKLHLGTMVHHGYQRPGDGYIVGDCPGVHQLPYEVSCDAIKSHKVAVERALVGMESRLADLNEGRVTRFTKTRMIGHSRHGRLEVTEYIVGVTEPYRFQRALDMLKADVEGDIRRAKSEITRCQNRINAWTLKPIRTVEEEVEKEQAAKAERKAVKDAARAARDAKKAATAAKQEALKVKREALVEGLRTEFRTLASQPKSVERDAAVRTVCDKVNSKKFSWMWMFDLGIIETLVQLDLAQKFDDGRVSFKSPLVRG